jgi:NMD protein affecting ribosome stability and mRNA decay
MKVAICKNCGVIRKDDPRNRVCPSCSYSEYETVEVTEEKKNETKKCKIRRNYRKRYIGKY